MVHAFNRHRGAHGQVIGIAIIIAVMALSALRYAMPPAMSPDLRVTPAEFNHPLGAQQLILMGERIDINTASERDLQALYRVGPVLAARIIEERDFDGPFHSVDDLKRVRGIGKRIVERNRVFMKVE